MAFQTQTKENLLDALERSLVALRESFGTQEALPKAVRSESATIAQYEHDVQMGAMPS